MSQVHEDLLNEFSGQSLLLVPTGAGHHIMKNHLQRLARMHDPPAECQGQGHSLMFSVCRLPKN